MKSLFFRLLILVFGVSFGWSSANACGELRLEASGKTVSWQMETQTVEMSVKVSRSDSSSACDFFVSVSGDPTERSNGLSNFNLADEEIEYRITPTVNADSGSFLRQFQNSLDEAHVLIGSFPSNSSAIEQTFTFFLEISGDRNDIPSPGLYSDSMTIQVFEGTVFTADVADPDSQLVIENKVFVGEFVDLSIVPPGNNFVENDRNEHLDFGRLSEGKEKSADIVVRTNTPHLLEVVSQNSGVMVHEVASVATVVPYELKIDQQLLDLKNSQQETVDGELAQVINKNFLRHNMNIRIGDLTGVIAGKYQDAVTITIRSKN